MSLRGIHTIYFIGIGGIGMSALAKYFHAVGKQVSGYDKVASAITEGLRNLGIVTHYEDSLDLIPENFKNKHHTLVVYTPAVSSDHLGLNFFNDNGFKVMKRAEVLGLITKNSFCLAVAGTHGKTTTTAILGHIMQPYNATSFLGGISENYHSNLILGKDEISVVEADEFDRSFLKLSPNIACVTSTDADHLDIYGEKTSLENSFQEFADKVSNQLIVAKGCKLDGLTYAVEEDADYSISNIKRKNGQYIFDIKTPHKIINEVSFLLPGKHNMMNALAAFAMADCYGIPAENIKKSLETFRGVERRFSYKIRSEKLTLIDDYAHHPTEIRAVYSSIKELYPFKKNIVVFQPHLFSRTRDFIEDFAVELAKFDEVLLLDIYPAREMPIKGVSSLWLLEKILNKNKKITDKINLVKDIKNSEANIVIMLGAGDIGKMVEGVKNELISIC
ncbi:UDP-N-acetylmuramate--L-alanine ligase [Flavobacteriaceae bacterium]|nr:UDP-N-acetylmuramate--L-alanine ligase [Flavobacteriaceae bacterium]